MRSTRPKVLHEIGNRPLIGHVASAAAAAGVSSLAVVVGPDRTDVADAAARFAPEANAFVQAERLGTGHAVLSAASAVTEDVGDVLVLLGDAPLVRPETIASARAALSDGADVVVVGFQAADPTGYGRLLLDGDQVTTIREHRDASPSEREIRFCNSGLMAFAGPVLLDLVQRIGNDNAKGEYYLTDAIEIAHRDGRTVRAIEADEEEVMGINDRAQLAICEAAFQARRRQEAMAGGVTLIAPDTVWFSADTELASDVAVEPHVVFGPEVSIETGAKIRAFSHLEGARISANAQIGPYARLRPGTEIGIGARIGNFVEVKNASFGDGAKANHLSYVGDASVGAGANVGAGTITCNYDGFLKYRTEIGAGAFVGSNSALVAPITIGTGAFVGSGSVVTDDVPDNALAIARGRQANKLDWAMTFREMKSAQKRQK
ncbi:MAG: bifunctional UDP-N-acetylglucosamine diphosphorylase/glucosamine-1-phosphate N-acetyltransferase GlmU [Pseudomonadota bacterium]